MRILFLDDDENRHNKFAQTHIGEYITQVRTVEACIDAIKNNPRYDLISLDHDLGGQVYVEAVEGTGTEVANWMATEMAPEKMPDRVWIHSFNPAGAKRMHDILAAAGIPVRKRPFGGVRL